MSHGSFDVYVVDVVKIGSRMSDRIEVSTEHQSILFKHLNRSVAPIAYSRHTNHAQGK